MIVVSELRFSLYGLILTTERVELVLQRAGQGLAGDVAGQGPVVPVELARIGTALAARGAAAAGALEKAAGQHRSERGALLEYCWFGWEARWTGLKLGLAVTQPLTSFRSPAALAPRGDPLGVGVFLGLKPDLGAFRLGLVQVIVLYVQCGDKVVEGGVHEASPKSTLR